MVDPAVFPLAKLGCGDQGIPFEPHRLKRQAARALADILLRRCRQLVVTPYPGLIAFLFAEEPLYPSHSATPHKVIT